MFSDRSWKPFQSGLSKINESQRGDGQPRKTGKNTDSKLNGVYSMEPSLFVSGALCDAATSIMCATLMENLPISLEKMLLSKYFTLSFLENF